MNQNCIILSKVFKVYNKQVVLKDVSYKFKRNLYVLSGVNGSGKSTLVKLITKIIKPTKGDVITNGSICYLPEKFELPRNMTTFDIINLYVKNEKETNELLKEWEIPKKRLNSLSKGNFQKLGILFMIIKDADIYIFDEPTDSLDTKIIDTFKKCINYLKEKNKCIIIILHQLNIDELNPIKINLKEGVLC